MRRHESRKGVYKEVMEGLQEMADMEMGRQIIAARAEAAGLTVQEYLRRRRLKAKAKAKAAAYGLAYWPALYGRGCDPRAYVIAERVLARRMGSVWGEILPDGTRSHGGWDAWGHHGLSAADVEAMWLAAGCRDSTKFRVQVAAGVVAKKSDSASWLRHYVRGLRWLEDNRIRLKLSRKAIAALGRLSPELRRAALEGLFGREGASGPLRVRDLNWRSVRAAQEKLKSGALRVRAALAGNRRAAALLGVTLDSLPAALAPAYPRLPLHMARRLALGESPVQLSGGLLTRAEAHAWALAGAPEVTQWLAGHYGVPPHRSVRVIRWLVHCRQSGRWAAVERERTVRMPGEARERTYSLLSVLDEIQDEDIVTGRDSVDAVLRRAAQRLGDAWLTERAKDYRVLAPLPAWAQELPRGVRILRTPAELVAEGREMQHCVGGYIHAVERGQCHILSITTRQGRSTVELSPTLRVVQHRGVRNAEPPRRNAILLRAFLARITRQT